MAEIIAHRGDPIARVENTLPAIDQALADGARVVEIDIHLTADGEVVVVHDPTLLRLFGLDRRVDELTLAQVRELRARDSAGQAVGVSTLREALEVVAGRGRLLVDMTEASFAAPAVEVVASMPEAQGTAWCGDHGALRAVREAMPDAEIYLTMPDDEPPSAEMVAALRPRWVNPWWGVVTADYVQRVRELGAEVSCWTVDDVDDARELAALGVQCIISNRAAAIRKDL